MVKSFIGFHFLIVLWPGQKTVFASATKITPVSSGIGSESNFVSWQEK